MIIIFQTFSFVILFEHYTKRIHVWPSRHIFTITSKLLLYQLTRIIILIILMCFQWPEGINYKTPKQNENVLTPFKNEFLYYYFSLIEICYTFPLYVFIFLKKKNITKWSWEPTWVFKMIYHFPMNTYFYLNFDTTSVTLYLYIFFFFKKLCLGKILSCTNNNGYIMNDATLSLLKNKNKNIKIKCRILLKT